MISIQTFSEVRTPAFSYDEKGTGGGLQERRKDTRSHFSNVLPLKKVLNVTDRYNPYLRRTPQVLLLLRSYHLQLVRVDDALRGGWLDFVVRLGGGRHDGGQG